MMIKQLINRIRFPHTYSSGAYVAYLRKLGMEIGDDVTIYSPRGSIIDKQYPWMIKIGNHVRISTGVTILTHDFSWSVLKNYSGNNDNAGGAVFGASGKVTIGDNVFIGMHSIILRGAKIGNDVIIGAGSIVTGECEDGWVYAGNPARKMIRVEEYYRKREVAQLEEAVILVQEYYRCFHKAPPQEVLFEYFMLFADPDHLAEKYEKQLQLGGTKEKSIQYMRTSKRMFSDFDTFIAYCLSETMKKRE